jgi:osmotically-inducible protein OsmY
MGWLDRLFGHHDAAAAPEASADGGVATEVPPERKGLNGEYDQSGLAKRVAQAFEQNNIDDIPHLYVAQTGTKVVLEGKAPDQATLDHLVQVASGVEGATEVDTSKVEVTG